MTSRPDESYSSQLTHLRLWDGVSDDYSAFDSLQIEDGTFVRVGEEANAGANPSNQRNLQGLTAIPGLIDAHVHLCLNPEIRNALDQGKESEPELLELMRVRAETMLRHGITTARDLGGGTWTEFKVRDAILRRELVGPRLVCSGQPITSVKGHCHFWGGEADSIEAALEVLTRQIHQGADLIKVMATGGNLTPGSTPSQAQFDEAAMRAIVASAKIHGKAVAAHCHGTAGIRNAARAGVTTVEHCSWVSNEGWHMDYDAEVAAQMARQGVWVSPTINLGWQRNIGRTGYEERVINNFTKVREAGVGLITSTDAGIPNVFHHDLAKTLPLFSHFTQSSPVQTLRSATSQCANALGLGETTGRIATGLQADLLFVEGDPLSDLSCLSKPVAVMAAGRWIDLTANLASSGIGAT